MIRIAVIVGQFFPVSDISEGHQPDRAGRLCDFTVRITGMVAIACRVPKDRAINIVAVIEGKNVDIALGKAPGTFGFGNLFPDVGENASSLFDILGGKEPEPSNTRLMHPDPHLHGSLTALVLYPRPVNKGISYDHYPIFIKRVRSLPDGVNTSCGQAQTTTTGMLR
jgi:hypothetical protein